METVWPISRLWAEANPVMASSPLIDFFRPYTHMKYCSENAKVGRQETIFVSLEGIRLWAEASGLGLRQAMIRLLAKNIWPERFRRNFGLFSSRELARLLQSHALVLGCGGLGGHVAELLARSGVGSLRLVDSDVFDESNLNRQRFCSERVLGKPKAFVVRDALADIASHVETEALNCVASEDTLPDLVAGMDVALDCLDNIGDKAALERAALAEGVAFVHGSVLREEGFSYLNSGPEERLAELYPQGQTSNELDQSRRESVSALAPASIACLMVRFALDALLGRSARRPLYHLDLSVPELERFAWAESSPADAISPHTPR